MACEMCENKKLTERSDDSKKKLISRINKLTGQMNGIKKMIEDVDKSAVLDSGVIDSPVLGKIPPVGLSGGVKTLILVKFEKDKIFNASTCGDNCAKWLLKIAETEDRTINLHHLMDFGDEKFTIHIANTDQIVHSMEELVSIAGEFV